MAILLSPALSGIGVEHENDDDRWRKESWITYKDNWLFLNCNRWIFSSFFRYWIFGSFEPTEGVSSFSGDDFKLTSTLSNWRLNFTLHITLLLIIWNGKWQSFEPSKQICGQCFLTLRYIKRQRDYFVTVFLHSPIIIIGDVCWDSWRPADSHSVRLQYWSRLPVFYKQKCKGTKKQRKLNSVFLAEGENSACKMYGV